MIDETKKSSKKTLFIAIASVIIVIGVGAYFATRGETLSEGYWLMDHALSGMRNEHTYIMALAKSGKGLCYRNWNGGEYKPYCAIECRIEKDKWKVFEILPSGKTPDTPKWYSVLISKINAKKIVLSDDWTQGTGPSFKKLTLEKVEKPRNLTVPSSREIEEMKKHGELEYSLEKYILK